MLLRLSDLVLLNTNSSVNGFPLDELINLNIYKIKGQDK